ncbi:MAG: metallophosphoesterase [Clostridium sp.]|uniref:metallophosphoesterase n=1 Tax=Clostridium sp. TaxID=1506 RepID=UPI001EB0FBBA|nr:metallophosphoesterase [Clostridium sp.]MBS5885504.1 metallophosphoesterase [Clostridium sp.]MDU7149202.1 metallophosphoesterase [Clostridium sp.]
MIKRTKRIIASMMLATVMASTTNVAFAAENDGWTEASQTEAAKNGAWEAWCEKWETIKNDWTQLSISPGENESELNFAWYSKDGESSPKVKISKSKDMSNAIAFDGAQSNAVPGYLSNKVTVTGLENSTKYFYSYGTNGNWSEAVEINTQNTDKFNFILVGDPQIGSSLKNAATGETDAMGQDKSVRNDSFNWNNTLNKALSLVPNASFMISAGDQISIRNKKATTEEALVYTENEIEYAGYLSPDALKSLPAATTLGNHDAVSGNYSYHFNNPNASELGMTVGGGNYYYTYGNTLFINLNTNNRNIAEHKQFIEEAVSKSKDSTWRVVTIHHDIYGSGEHSNEPEIVELRYALVPIFEENNIDVVLTGHDHTYARSKILKGGVMDEEAFISEDEYEAFFDAEFESGYTDLVTDKTYLDYLKSIEDENAVVTDLNIESGKVVDPDGILYITANSASGSKYYDNVPRQQAYIANRWQEDVPTFSNISVDEVSLSISTYRTDTMEKIDETYTIVKSLDKTNLVDLIKIAEEKVKADYTSSTWAVFEGALTNAKAISNQADATSEIVTKAYTDLNTSMNSLVLQGNKEELNTTIEEATKIADKAVVGSENGNYKEEDKEALLAAINEAKAILSSDDANQTAVDEAVAKLKEAIKTFESKVIVIDNNDGTLGNGTGDSGNNGSTSNNANDGTSDGNSNYGNNGNSTNGANNSTSSNNTTSAGKGNSSVNTGDSSNLYMYGILAASMLALAAIKLKKTKEEKAEAK